MPNAIVEHTNYHFQLDQRTPTWIFDQPNGIAICAICGEVIKIDYDTKPKKNEKIKEN